MKKNRIKTTVQILFAVMLMICPLTQAAPVAEKPNIVLILSDDQAWTDYGFMGHPEIKTPHLDQLASESLLFRKGYVAVLVCRPSLASMVTGPSRWGQQRSFMRR